MTIGKYHPSILSQEEYSRYARHLILDEIGIQGQYRLKQAKILMIGAGGLACPCIIYLVRSGIGSIGIIDNDIVSMSNLHRQVLYEKQDINQLKTEIAKRKIQQINATCKVNIYSDKLTHKNAHLIIKNYDLIIDTSDNFETRYIIDDICNKLHKIHIYGAIQNFEGQISVFNYKGGPKYSDIYPKYLNLENNNCNNLGVLGVLPGIIGVLQATEAIKVIIGLKNILSGNILLYNAHNMSFKKIKILKKKNLNYKYNKNHINNTNIIHCIDLIKINKQKVTIVDVRQNIEFQKEKIFHAINIPLKELSYKYNINFLLKISNNKDIIVYCSNNSRSIVASNILHKYGVNHLRLKNGLYNWVKITS